jgi:tripartite-type tricarboxylate transporter receptor subunit TctC
MFRHLFGRAGRRAALVASAFTLLLSTPLQAQAAYPDKPIRLIVPYPAGGAADVMARALAQKLGADLGQTFIIDNRAGASGMVASEAVAKSPPDGYTLMFGALQTHAINPALFKSMRYDPVKDFTPISLTHINPRVLIVSASLQVNTLAELIARAKSKPGALTYGSAGIASSSHLAGAMFEAMAGVDMLHVPYKGSAPLVTDILSGRVDMSFDSYTVYEEHIRSGKVKALGVTAQQRMAVLPNVPTIAEAGLKGYEVLNWLGVLAPPGTPDAIVKRLNSAIAQSMKQSDLRDQLKALGIEPTSSTPEQFAALIRAEIPKWAEVVKRAGATAE